MSLTAILTTKAYIALRIGTEDGSSNFGHMDDSVAEEACICSESPLAYEAFIWSDMVLAMFAKKEIQKKSRLAMDLVFFLSLYLEITCSPACLETSCHNPRN